MSLGQRLQSLRKTKGMSQDQLAGMLNVSRQAVSKWEMDTSMPDADNLVQLSDLFEVSTDYLLKNTQLQPAVQAPMQIAQAVPPQENRHVALNIIGSIFLIIGMLGCLTLCIMGSLSNVTVSYGAVQPAQPVGTDAVPTPSETEYILTGLPAFLEYYNVTWLLVLCGILAVVGVGMLFYPKLMAKWQKRKA